MFSHICWNILEQASATLSLSALETKSLLCKTPEFSDNFAKGNPALKFKVPSGCSISASKQNCIYEILLQHPGKSFLSVLRASRLQGRPEQGRRGLWVSSCTRLQVKCRTAWRIDVRGLIKCFSPAKWSLLGCLGIASSKIWLHKQISCQLTSGSL